MAGPPLFRPGMALPLLWEDRHFAVINKPAGLAVHPGPQGRDNVEDRLLPQKRGGPWLVHRLDADTAGCLLIARRKTALIAAQQAFAGRRTIKRYWALVNGRPDGQDGTISSLLRRVSTPQGGWRMVSTPMQEQDMPPADLPAGTTAGGAARARTPRGKDRRAEPARDSTGKLARTSWRLLASDGTTSLLELTLHTGRTHQARLHCAALGTPILGDPLYGTGPSSPHAPTTTLQLLARTLEIGFPSGEQHQASAAMPAIKATAPHTGMENFMKAHPVAQHQAVRP